MSESPNSPPATVSPLDINSAFSGNAEHDAFPHELSSWLFNSNVKQEGGLLQLTSEDFFAPDFALHATEFGKLNAGMVPVRQHKTSDSDESARVVSSPDSGVSGFSAESTKGRDSVCYVPNSPDFVDEASGPGAGTHRKKAHLASEKKRRTNLKDAFEELKMLVPSCRNFPQHKNSKESVLRKAINYIKFLVKQQYLLAEEIQNLKATIKNAGLEVPPSPCEDMISEDFASGKVDGETIPEYTKIFILLTIVDSIFESFQAQVKTTSPEELTQTLLLWIQKNCRQTLCPQS